MDEGMESMLDMYLFETNSMIEQLDNLILEAEKSKSFTFEAVNEIFRIMHTIKGSSAMMQFGSIMTVAHKMEDVFFVVRQNGLQEKDSAKLFDLMFLSADFIKAQIDRIQNCEPIIEDDQDISSELNGFLSKLKGEDMPQTSDIEPKPTQQIPQNATYMIKVFFDKSAGMLNVRAFMLVMGINDVCDNYTYSPANVDTDSATESIIIDQGFTLHFFSQKDVDLAIQVIKDSSYIKDYKIEIQVPEESEEPIEATKLEELIGAPEPLETFWQANDCLEIEKNLFETQVEEQKQTAQMSESSSSLTYTQQNAATTTAKQNIISVNLWKLDKLMDIVGEIVIIESMVASSPELQGLKLDTFTKSERQLRKLIGEMQETVMSVRMVPVAGVFHKMNRVIRDMSQKLNKQVRLTIIGEDTEVDKTVVDGIGDPIMHLVRNAMDHGIENDVSERIKNGKDAEAEIILSAEHTGSEVIISVSDDGKGVDLVKVLLKAKANGILTKPESEYTKKEILHLLMAPGFTTKEQVTEFSGRGVGMDVVKKNIENVGGVIMLSSELHQGTIVSFKIPLSLAIIAGMGVAVGNYLFTIPINNIRQSFKPIKAEIAFDSKRNEMVNKGHEFVPVIRLHDYFNIDTNVNQLEDGIMIWIEVGDKSYCLFVDRLIGEQNVVAKPLPSLLSVFKMKESGIASCTILGNGSISLILDLANIQEAACI